MEQRKPASKPDLVADPSRDEVIALGQALEAVLDSAPWKALDRLLEQHTIWIGRFGLRDKEHEPAYWAGYQDGVDDIRGAIPAYVERARALLAEATEEDEASAAFLGHFIGSGVGEVSGGE